MVNAKEGREILEAIFLDPPKSYIGECQGKKLLHHTTNITP